MENALVTAFMDQKLNTRELFIIIIELNFFTIWFSEILIFNPNWNKRTQKCKTCDGSHSFLAELQVENRDLLNCELSQLSKNWLFQFFQ